MVLHHREHDLVAGFDLRSKEARRDKIDRLGAALGEDDLLGGACVQEALNRRTRVLVALRRQRRQIMHAAMHIGIFVAGEFAHGVQHGARLLRRGGIVEIDQRPAIDFATEDFEIAARGMDVEGRCVADFGFGTHDATCASAASTTFQTTARMASSSISETASWTKARISSPRASASGMPRARR